MSADEPRCALTELPVSMCGHCRAPKAEPVPEVEISHFLLARYPGACAVCGGHISPDDRIGRLADQPGYACEDCLR